MTRNQSKLSRYAGDTNFLLGALRRARGAIQYLPFAPAKDDEFFALRNEVLRALDNLERYTRALRAEGHASLKAEQEKQNGEASTTL